MLACGISQWSEWWLVELANGWNVGQLHYPVVWMLSSGIDQWSKHWPVELALVRMSASGNSQWSECRPVELASGFRTQSAYWVDKQWIGEIMVVNINVLVFLLHSESFDKLCIHMWNQKVIWLLKCRILFGSEHFSVMLLAICLLAPNIMLINS